VGYAEIGLALTDKVTDDHPYGQWIREYAGESYREVARTAVATLDRLLSERGGPGRMESLIRTFRQATILEAEFWRMGLELLD
jgi:thiaminase (transcriptional activator TenA)